jgi:hypothetical protein
MFSARRFAAAATTAVIIVLAGCKTGDVPTNPGEEPPVVTQITCPETGNPGPCPLSVDSTITSFDIVLSSTSCDATDNHLRITEPVKRDLTDDACHDQVGKRWTVDGPFPAGTSINVEIVSSQLAREPELVSSGAFPGWTLTFEDGGDVDLNDVVLKVTAHQAE